MTMSNMNWFDLFQTHDAAVHQLTADDTGTSTGYINHLVLTTKKKNLKTEY